MTGKRLFLLNAVIAGGYGIALLLAAGPILDLYGITPNPEGTYMARWFGLELLGIGLVTWLARDATESALVAVLLLVIKQPLGWRTPTARTWSGGW